MLKRKGKCYQMARALYHALRAPYIRALRFFVSRRKLQHLTPSNHGLTAPLIVSLTSFPPRFPSLHLTIISLLTQKLRPDRLILWVAEKDLKLLPQEVTKLKRFGLEIKPYKDIRSYKKIIPTLIESPKAYIVTADDDFYYWKSWLKELVESYKSDPVDVVCQRADKIKFDAKGIPLKYTEWHSKVRGRLDSVLVFPVGVGGVLYAPNVFYKDILNEELFMTLCPTTDDVWLYWMHRLKGSRIRTLGNNRHILWPGSQKVALMVVNVGAARRNDEAVKNLIEKYGFPTD